jgi:SAM-dependent methyltransferase
MRLTERAHEILTVHLSLGDCAIDATTGNGHDAIHIATLIGEGGHLIGIDLQASAIKATHDRLKDAKTLCQIELIEGNHAEVLTGLKSTQSGEIKAVVFNLGYLPGSDKRIQTTPETTCAALETSKALLAPNGILLVTAYRGHAGGEAEALEVSQWMQSLESNEWKVEVHEPEAVTQSVPPILWVAQKIPNLSAST